MRNNFMEISFIIFYQLDKYFLESFVVITINENIYFEHHLQLFLVIINK